MTFAEKLALECARRGWNAADLARAVGVSKNTSGRWLSGQTRPFDAAALRLARTLELPAEFLLDDGLDSPPPPEVTSEEREVLGMVRDLGIPEARRRLLRPPGRWVDVTDEATATDDSPGGMRRGTG